MPGTSDKTQIVTKESATFGLAGHRETILGLDKDHSNMCRFDTAVEDDRDVYEFVENNFLWLFEEAMKEVAVKARLESLQLSDESILPKSKCPPEEGTS